MHIAVAFIHSGQLALHSVSQGQANGYVQNQTGSLEWPKDVPEEASPFSILPFIGSRIRGSVRDKLYLNAPFARQFTA